MLLQALSESIIIETMNSKWLLPHLGKGARPIRKESEHLEVSCPSALFLEHPMMRSSNPRRKF